MLFLFLMYAVVRVTSSALSCHFVRLLSSFVSCFFKQRKSRVGEEGGAAGLTKEARVLGKTKLHRASGTANQTLTFRKSLPVGKPKTSSTQPGERIHRRFPPSAVK